MSKFGQGTLAFTPETADLDSPFPIPVTGGRNQPAIEPLVPQEPATLADTGLTAGDIEALILRLLLTSGPAQGRKIAEQIRLPFGLVVDQLRALRGQLLVAISDQGTMGDFEYMLTEEGRPRARFHFERCTYCGAAPVPLDGYIAWMRQQSKRKERVRVSDVCRAMADLVLPPATLSQIGQALHAGRGLFLYGQPGNGKTSIAERLMGASSEPIWIPRTIAVTGEIIRVFDPASHCEVPLRSSQGQWLDALPHDRRWVRIRRPLIVVGGELRLEQLEITSNPTTGILEAPLQLKSNGGALVVDDFGRQRCAVGEVLNRLIVPLEKRYDFLNLPSGRQIQVPFDQLLVLSTNLPPHQVADEALLRRIGYKIEVRDPSPREFRELVQLWCSRLGVEFQGDGFDSLLARHYQEGTRPMRYCHARDLVQQVLVFCEFHELPPAATAKAFDGAAKNYFAGL